VFKAGDAIVVAEDRRTSRATKMQRVVIASKDRLEVGRRIFPLYFVTD